MYDEKCNSQQDPDAASTTGEFDPSSCPSTSWPTTEGCEQSSSQAGGSADQDAVNLWTTKAKRAVDDQKDEIVGLDEIEPSLGWGSLYPSYTYMNTSHTDVYRIAATDVTLNKMETIPRMLMPPLTSPAPANMKRVDKAEIEGTLSMLPQAAQAHAETTVGSSDSSSIPSELMSTLVDVIVDPSLLQQGTQKVSSVTAGFEMNHYNSSVGSTLPNLPPFPDGAYSDSANPALPSLLTSAYLDSANPALPPLPVSAYSDSANPALPPLPVSAYSDSANPALPPLPVSAYSDSANPALPSLLTSAYLDSATPALPPLPASAYSDSAYHALPLLPASSNLDSVYPYPPLLPSCAFHALSTSSNLDSTYSVYHNLNPQDFGSEVVGSAHSALPQAYSSAFVGSAHTGVFQVNNNAADNSPYLAHQHVHSSSISSSSQQIFPQVDSSADAGSTCPGVTRADGFIAYHSKPAAAIPPEHVATNSKEMEKKKDHVPIGPQHQAVIPDLVVLEKGPDHQADIPDLVHSEKDDAPRDLGTLLWDPSWAEDVDVSSYLIEAQMNNKLADSDVATSQDCRRGDDEHVLAVLLKNNYDVQRALDELKPGPDGPTWDWNELSPAKWHRSEIQRFVKAVRQQTRIPFSKVQQAVGTRSLKEVIHFYYFWKSSKRFGPYDVKKLMVKGDTSNPGTPEKDLEKMFSASPLRQGKRERSVSPLRSLLNNKHKTPPPAPDFQDPKASAGISQASAIPTTCATSSGSLPKSDSVCDTPTSYCNDVQELLSDQPNICHLSGSVSSNSKTDPYSPCNFTAVSHPLRSTVSDMSSGSNSFVNSVRESLDASDSCSKYGCGDSSSDSSDSTSVISVRGRKRSLSLDSCDRLEFGEFLRDSKRVKQFAFRTSPQGSGRSDVCNSDAEGYDSDVSDEAALLRNAKLKQSTDLSSQFPHSSHNSPDCS